jgi:hypothetical protein
MSDEKPMEELSPAEAQVLSDRLNQYSREFDQRCMEKHALGEEKYGPGTWLKIDNLEHALDEIVDLGNYVRFAFIKLRALQDNILSIQEGNKSVAQPIEGMEMLGKAGFVSKGEQ